MYRILDMFKRSEIAGIRAEPERRVTIIRGSGSPCIETSEGIFEESALFVVHPSVLVTTSGTYDREDSYIERMLAKSKAPGALPYELLAKVEKLVPKLVLDFSGHWKNGAAIRKEYRDRLLKHAYLGPNDMSQADAKDLLRAVKAKKALSKWVPLGLSEFRVSLRTCSFCGEQDFGLETNGQKIRIMGPKCAFPKGLPLTEFELNTPSGKLVVANDLRDLFPIDEDFDINTTWGCRKTVLAYAAVGLAHAFVGNSCPGVYRCKDGLFKIANPPSTERWNGKAYVSIKPKPRFEGKEVAGICTDLWWYSLCDHDEFLRRCGRFGRKAEDFRVKVVKVPSGVYRFEHDEGAQGYEGPKERVYTWFKRVRKAEPVKDFLASYEAVEVNAHAWVQAQALKWPTLFGKVNEEPSGRETPVPWAEMTEEDRHSAWKRVADHTMCVIGGGVDWHERGFPQGKVDVSIPDVEPPSFREQQHWYPFSKPYGGLFEPKVLAPSFAKLAFRILESVISFGTDVRDGEQSREVVYVRERMRLAVERYRQLAKQYPDLADPEYVVWLSQKGRAEAWVEGFDLGPEFTEKHAKHALAQRWIPEDAYAIEFDARKLKEGHFAWHPKVMGCWASKKDAQRYAFLQWEDNKQAPEHNCFWTSNAASTTVPLYVVARVTKVGSVSHMGETLVELAFDYGTPWMKGSSRKGLSEAKEKAGLRVLTKGEYEKLLPKAVKFYEDAEAEVRSSRSSEVGPT